MPIRVVVADDNVLLREGICQLVQRHDDLEVVGTAHDLPSLLAVVEAERPDVVLTDIRMPPTQTDEGIQAAARLRAEHPGTGVVVLSQYVNPAYVLALLADGSAGRAYLLKERLRHVAELMAAIREVAQGGSVIDPTVVESLVSAGSTTRAGELDRLTAREREVLGEMAQGMSNAAIASSLVLSERAVQKHINAIFAKLGLSEEHDVSRRVKAVLVYLHEAN